MAPDRSAVESIHGSGPVRRSALGPRRYRLRPQGRCRVRVRAAHRQMRRKKPCRCALRTISPSWFRMALMNWFTQMDASAFPRSQRLETFAQCFEPMLPADCTSDRDLCVEGMLTP